MSFKNLFVLLPLIISTKCFSQEDGRSELTNLAKVAFFTPGISYEKKVGKFQSLYGQVFMNTFFGIGYSSSLGTNSFIYVDPALRVHYRYYYNSGKRKAKGKRTELNSANYMCSFLQTVFSNKNNSYRYTPEKKWRPINIVGMAWGLQRNYPNRFSIDLNLGGGYLFTKVTTIDDAGQYLSKNAGQFTSVVQIDLGFWLNKRK